VALVAVVYGASWDDPVFRAMEDEMMRSMDQLVIEGMPSPYFMSYRIRDYVAASYTARYGAKVVSDKSHQRFLYVDLRVGDYSLDNSNYFAGWRDIWNQRDGLVEENDYDGLRHQLWYYTDLTYKSALETLAGKKAYLQAHPVKEEIPDFSQEDPFVYRGTPVRLEQAGRWEQRVCDAAAVCKDYAGLQDWNVQFSAQAVNQWYVNSEGSKHLKGHVYHILEISATTQADDGQRLTGFLNYVTRDEEEPVSGMELEEEIRELAEQLLAAANAPALDEYVGPVLFSDYAAAQFLSKLLADQLTLVRKPLTAMEWMNESLPVGKLAGKIKRRILPEFVTITDEPQRESWEGLQLAGYQKVDDEGVQTEDITLVEDGRFMTIPMGRQPTKKISNSNGHARSTPFQLTLPGISNLIVTSSETKKLEKMKKEMMGLCKEQDIEFGLWVRRLEELRYSDYYRWIDADEGTETLLTPPLVVYKVYADDGRMEPVRGLEFDELSVRAMRDIVLMGKDTEAYNILQSTIYGDAYYPASIVTPSMLVEEMELVGTTTHEPMPVAQNPIFE
jgi:predicted Zn-dependent protease